MLKNMNNDVLAEKSICENYYLFYQIWKELTDRRTLDSYQFRVMNSISILTELNNIILFQLEGAPKQNHHIKECCLEAQEIIQSDVIIKKHFRTHWNKLLNCLNKKIDSTASLRSLHYMIEYTYNALNPTYLPCLFSELEQAFIDNNYNLIGRLTNAIVSYCVFIGWSHTALYSLIDLLEGSSKNPLKWSTFKESLLSPEDKTYKVYIPIKILPNPPAGTSRINFTKTVYSAITTAGIDILTEESIKSKYSILENEKISREKYMQFTETAYDAFSACTKASEKCSTVLNMLSFYNYIKPWNTDQLLFLTIECDTDLFEKISPGKLHSTTNHLINGKKIFETSKNLLITNNSTLGAKLRSSYSFLNIGKGSTSLEDKFINTWVALESLCRSDAYENIATNILNVVPPALCLKYIYRLFNNFIEDCFRCSIDLSFSDPDITIMKKNRHETRVRDLFAILNNKNLSQELERRCLVNTLLGQRYKRIYSLATDSQIMFDAIKQHYQTTKRQLARLYRIRNQIAHTGSVSIDSLALYTDHLTNYLVTFTIEMVAAAGIKNENRAEVLIELIRNSYDVFLQIANEKDPNIHQANLSKLLDRGIIDYL